MFEYLVFTQSDISIQQLKGAKRFFLFDECNEQYMLHSKLLKLDENIDKTMKFYLMPKDYEYVKLHYNTDTYPEDIYTIIDNMIYQLYTNNTDKYSLYGEYLDKDIQDIKNDIHHYFHNNQTIYFNNIINNKYKTINDIFDIKIDDLDFKIRVNNGLIRKNINNVGQLLKTPIDVLKEIKGYNDTFINNISHRIFLLKTLFPQLSKLNINDYPLLSLDNQILEYNDEIIDIIISMLSIDIETLYLEGLDESLVRQLLNLGITNTKDLIKRSDEIINEIDDCFKSIIKQFKEDHSGYCFICNREKLIQYIKDHDIKDYNEIEKIEDEKIKNKIKEIYNLLNKGE